jgi:hypothetical protein
VGTRPPRRPYRLMLAVASSLRQGLRRHHRGGRQREASRYSRRPHYENVRPPKSLEARGAPCSLKCINLNSESALGGRARLDMASPGPNPEAAAYRVRPNSEGNFLQSRKQLGRCVTRDVNSRCG